MDCVTARLIPLHPGTIVSPPTPPGAGLSERRRFGLVMPGVPLIHGRYYQEIAPGVAMDRAEILGLDDMLTVADGRLLAGLLRIKESSPLELGVRESKMYAPGIGLVLDGSLRLAGTSRREATAK
jgi:hypothetical protein